jgi:hypothetical protein
MVLQNLIGVLRCCCCCGLMELRQLGAAAAAGAAAELLAPCLLGWGLSDGHSVSILDDQVFAPADLASIQRSDGLCHVQHSRISGICDHWTNRPPVHWPRQFRAAREHTFGTCQPASAQQLHRGLSTDDVLGGSGMHLLREVAGGVGDEGAAARAACLVVAQHVQLQDLPERRKQRPQVLLCRLQGTFGLDCVAYIFGRRAQQRATAQWG